ncbi:hypothetical protein SAMN05216266_12239 [Amycolatopsis marina]|uniref:Uncharacterized protein n=1 Tax=Amycolatopsis marina TaxID=490629 RepID=A0A1I1CC46_9PSEU|nr:hypothetical protein SAMN05216266_12239 [Amycolatopsis marina]
MHGPDSQQGPQHSLALVPPACRLGDAVHHETEHDRGDGHVEQEDGGPVEALHDHARDHRSEADRECVRATPDSQRKPDFLNRKRITQQCERRRLQQRSGKSLENTTQNESQDTAGKGDSDRCDSKTENSDDEYLPPAEPVRQSARGQ